MLFVKKDWLAFLSIPISTKIFGQNKTIRGFIVLPVFGGFWAFVFSFALGPFVDSYAVDASIGVGLGVVYLLSELPNSFIKRRLGIANGQRSEKHKWLQMLADKMDSLIGMILFYYFVTPIGIYE